MFVMPPRQTANGDFLSPFLFSLCSVLPASVFAFPYTTPFARDRLFCLSSTTFVASSPSYHFSCGSLSHTYRFALPNPQKLIRSWTRVRTRKSRKRHMSTSSGPSSKRFVPCRLVNPSSAICRHHLTVRSMRLISRLSVTSLPFDVCLLACDLGRGRCLDASTSPFACQSLPAPALLVTRIYSRQTRVRI